MNLATLIPPPLVTLVVCGMVYWAENHLSQQAWRFQPNEALRAASLGLLALGLALMLAAVIEFFRARTTVNPMRPQNTRALITTGVFRYSRNPIYLGDALLILAFGLWIASPWVILGLVGFVSYMQHFQIKPEEHFLREKFRQAHQDYCLRTRRWV